MNTRLLIPFLLTAVVLAGLFIRRIGLGLRMTICMLFSLTFALFAWVGSFASHRMAMEKAASLGQPPSDEWIKGASATRDAGQSITIFWLLSLIILAVLCVYLFRQVIKQGQPK